VSRISRYTVCGPDECALGGKSVAPAHTLPPVQILTGGVWCASLSINKVFCSKCFQSSPVRYQLSLLFADGDHYEKDLAAAKA